MKGSFPGGREIIRLALIEQGIPEQATDAAIGSISISTLRNYSVTFKKWWFFCKSNQCDLFNPEIECVLSFLNQEYEKGLSYSALNGMRSAVAFIAKKYIANDSRVSEFFCGIPRNGRIITKCNYNYTWDPIAVLNYFSNLGSNESLSFKLLSRKLVALLALVTWHSLQSFSLIEVRNIKKLDSNIEIYVSTKTKRSAEENLQFLLNLPNYHEKNLCIASCLARYLDVTENFRGPVKNLFISINKPFKAISTHSMSRWVKEALIDSGVYTSIFLAHSTRFTSSSATRSRVDIESIRKTIRWSSKSEEFLRFYTVAQYYYT